MLGIPLPFRCSRLVALGAGVRSMGFAAPK
jgi:hypothetical protein